MKKIVISRRQVLRGAGGFSLGLPFLSSLATPRGAYAATVTPARQPRFVAFTTEHGGIAGQNMFPDPSTLTEKVPLFPGHEARAGCLVRRVTGADAALSPVLTAPAAQLTDALVGKMNVIRGFDIPFYIAHHTGGHLGNYARNDGNGSEGKMMQAFPFPTIDQVMAWSPSFYRDLGGIKERTIITGTRGGFSWGWSNPGAGSGVVQEVRREESSLALFKRVFIPTATSPEAVRTPIVDRVLEHYKQLRNGNLRLSAADKQRLDDHMDRMAELQRRLTVKAPASCGGLKTPTLDSRAVGPSDANPVNAQKKFALYNDVIAAAFMCGTCRIAVVSVADTFSSYSGDWHQEVAHKHTLADAQRTLVSALRLTFSSVFVDLCTKLDVEEANGRTYLDNALVQWTQESGAWTHDAASIPIVTAGSAGGFLRTGQHIDFRRLVEPGRLGKDHDEFGGLTYNRWLATVLQAMGIPRSEFERKGVQGYGHPFVAPPYSSAYVSGVVDRASEIPAVLQA